MDVVNWTKLAETLDEQGFLDREDVFVVAPYWIDGGKIDYALRGRVPVVVFNPHPKHFLYRYDQEDLLGHDALLIGIDDNMTDVLQRLGPYFTSLGPERTVTIERAGEGVVDLTVIDAQGYRQPYTF